MAGTGNWKALAKDEIFGNNDTFPGLPSLQQGPIRRFPPALPDFETFPESGGKAIKVRYKADDHHGACRWIMHLGKMRRRWVRWRSGIRWPGN